METSGMKNPPRKSRKWRYLGIGFAIWFVGSLAAVYFSGALSALGMKEVVIDTVPPTLPRDIIDAAARGEVTILDFSKTAGFRHEEAIPAASASLARIAAENGWKIFKTENAAVFNPKQLALFRVVFGNNCTGDNWTEEQKQSFIDYLDRGGNFVGVHGAAGTRYRFWDWYNDGLLRALFIGHPLFPQFQEAVVVVEDATHPAMRDLPTRWTRTDEWYSFAENPRDQGVNVLATLDETTYEPKAFFTDLSMGDHPIIWSHCTQSGGRVFYSALGHSAEAYKDTAHEAMLSGAIRWAAGLAGTCATPGDD